VPSSRSFAKNTRNAIIAEAALAFGRDRLSNKLSGGQRKRRRPGVKTLLIGGAVAAGVAAVLKRHKVAGLLPSHSHAPADTFTPPPSTAPRPPAPISNYDAPGPVANTATPIPAPEPQSPPAIDEAAEEAAAVAEADLPAEPGELPLAEAGEGESEGGEQIDAELVEAAGETVTPEPITAAPDPEPAAAESDPAPAEKPLPASEPESGGGSEWQTWSGRAIKP
jgi:hypothetical protein